MDRETRDLIARTQTLTWARRPAAVRRVRSQSMALPPDRRWAAVQGATALLVTISVAWMALGIMPITRPMVAPGRAALPYLLFVKLMSANNLQGTGDTDRASPPPGVESQTVTLESGDTLGGMLEDAGVSADDANSVVTALGKDFNPRALKAGQTFDLSYTVADVIDARGGTEASGKAKTTTVMVNGKPMVVPVDAEDDTSDAVAETAQPISRLLSLRFSPSIEQDVTVTRTTSGNFTAQRTAKQLEVHHHHAGGTIDSSLYLAAMQAGIPADVVVDMIHMFSYKVDFQRDLQPGDRFEVYYDYYYTPEGQPAKIGAISYAMIDLDGKKIAMYRFQPNPDEPAEYFDADGQSSKGMLMKTPVDGARISSRFGSRFHPVLGYTRMHKGVDFAVPVGTPVMAAGAGTIKFMGKARGYGNFVIINNGDGYSTAYGHLSRFASGMHSGSHVHQGQVFAYSGNTGLTTGPHLHYEIRINGKQVNPLTVKIAKNGRKLKGKLLSSFEHQRAKIDNMLATTPLETKVADIAADLRQAVR